MLRFYLESRLRALTSPDNLSFSISPTEKRLSARIRAKLALAFYRREKRMGKERREIVFEKLNRSSFPSCWQPCCLRLARQENDGVKRYRIDLSSRIFAQINLSRKATDRTDALVARDVCTRVEYARVQANIATARLLSCCYGDASSIHSRFSFRSFFFFLPPPPPSLSLSLSRARARSLRFCSLIRCTSLRLFASSLFDFLVSSSLQEKCSFVAAFFRLSLYTRVVLHR